MPTSTAGSYNFNTTTGRYEFVPAPPTKAELQERLKRYQQGVRDCKRRGQLKELPRQEAEIAALKAKIAAM